MGETRRGEGRWLERDKCPHGARHRCTCPEGRALDPLHRCVCTSLGCLILKVSDADVSSRSSRRLSEARRYINNVLGPGWYKLHVMEDKLPSGTQLEEMLKELKKMLWDHSRVGKSSKEMPHDWNGGACWTAWLEYGPLGQDKDDLRMASKEAPDPSQSRAARKKRQVCCTHASYQPSTCQPFHGHSPTPSRSG